MSRISRVQEQEIIAACRVLFGDRVSLNRAFLAYIQEEGIQDAYRLRAKSTHPDRFPGADVALLQVKAADFRKVAKAYGTLRKFIEIREQGLWAPFQEDGNIYNRVHNRRATVNRNRPQKSPKIKKNYPSANFNHSNSSRRRSSSGLKLPQRPLPFGLFLNYSGLISYMELTKALLWQRQQRPRLGDLSLRWGRLYDFQVRRILNARSSGVASGRFGERAVQLGLLSQFQVDTMIHYQRLQQQPLGEYFVEQNILRSPDIEQLLCKLHDHNEQVMVESSFLRRFLGVFW